MNKEQIRTAINEFDQNQLNEFNNNSSANILFNATPGSGYSGAVSSVIDDMEALSNEDYFWLENNVTLTRVGGVRSSRPC